MKYLILIIISLCFFSVASANSIIGIWNLEYVGCQSPDQIITKSHWGSMLENRNYVFSEDGSFTAVDTLFFICNVSIAVGSYNWDWEENILKMTIITSSNSDGGMFSCSGSQEAPKEEVSKRVKIKGDTLYFFDDPNEERCDKNTKPVQVFSRAQ